ncbi:signal peptidase II [Colwellia sp. MB02u-18]|uniref:signal peptidase II n=1 Tax=unclassified Colwellia TaxID=196834 RepID=UPI0015F3EBF0|nr:MULTISPECIES: signal peptidase II [unclassified Colwellia]MBA6224694.1 signal peptidase II [Colwellia sp. MB3u-45]MBA6266707.1 signal peptidase II [Colwellia sp. MB3u-43]MBA6319725.1 signal peptidase II [Colwellia sp. MB02u-19]MBA6325434.1 signal peptidase II [Colwellia sp. MB02u-18]MBA6330146.1 signal peptidase II [Colwellia sp. MB02u-12]
MKKLFTETGLRWLWLTLVFLVADQVTKQLIVSNMDLYQSIDILPFFNFTYVHNLGAAFSFLADQGGWQRWFFTAIAAIASIVFIVWLAKTPKQQALLSVAFALMLSGAVGNLIDRVLFGYVIDFLDFYGFGYHFPAFNIADSMIFIGAALMIFDSFKNGEPSKNTQNIKT